MVRKKGAGQAKLDKLLKDDKSTEVQIGWFPKNRYKDGTYVAQVAATNEFGKGRIPPRPFMRTTISEKRKEWGKLTRKLGKLFIDGKIDSHAFLELLSLTIEGNIRKKIEQITTPALSETTIQKRLEGLKDKTRTTTLEKPLIDTAIMINSLTRVIK